MTRWLGGLKAGDERALEPLWDRYYATLVERARAKLAALRSATAVNDEEDLALVAFQSLYDGVRAGRFPRLEDRDDLWRLLIHLTACKAIDRHRAESRQKRGRGRVFNETDIYGGRHREGKTRTHSTGSSAPSQARSSPQGSPKSTLGRLDTLGDVSLRTIAEMKLACYSNDEIRQRLGCSLRTVTLKLELIRKKWQMSVDPAMSLRRRADHPCSSFRPRSPYVRSIEVQSTSESTNNGSGAKNGQAFPRAPALGPKETSMIHGLLIGTLALMLGTTIQIRGGEPDDPYQWLEDVTGEKALAWVRERNAESTGELTGSEQFQKLERRILEILDSDERIPLIQKIGPYYYNFWRDAKNPRGLWRRTTLGRVQETQAQLGNCARPRRSGKRRESQLGLARRVSP